MAVNDQLHQNHIQIELFITLLPSSSYSYWSSCLKVLEILLSELWDQL